MISSLIEIPIFWRFLSNITYPHIYFFIIMPGGHHQLVTTSKDATVELS